ncbi:MAG: hypothetical protein IJA65_04885 [Acholeplasmatales bacterium]|nr:hypothetical protein [Acholeplasmatales bacterium]
MEALEQFSKRIESSISRAYEGGVVLLPFLDEAQIGVITSEMKWHSEIKASKSGKIINADRVRYIIAPKDYDTLDFNIVVFKIIYNKKYYTIYHRSILGSLMSLGIKRECIGDIIIDDNNDAYFACTKEISEYILESFKFIGKAPIELEIENKDIINIPKYEEKLSFVASLRLDAIIAQAYNISRKEALELISGGLVYINHVLTLNVSHMVKLDDIISVRHKGKFKLSEIGNKSKSGRLAIKIAKRI